MNKINKNRLDLTDWKYTLMSPLLTHVNETTSICSNHDRLIWLESTAHTQLINITWTNKIKYQSCILFFRYLYIFNSILFYKL